ncbi:uncharacterized protein LOC132755843 [Ruditapes philippinarum]|uniref:uncharacterized protein LOC132755843 n=1 Tax=Ruditapes philippinarum TaxID=129788 RepID=UPI00295B8E99|nr:uncharacterized protein LOC132755843 [Ruditapes philippinarum]
MLHFARKYVRESDDDEWESDDICEVEKRDKLKLGSKHTTKTRLKASNKQKGRMKRTGTRIKDVPTLLKKLYLVYNKLVSLCINIASVYATTTPYNAKDPILLCLTTKKCRHIPPKFMGFSTIEKPFYPTSTESESYINETYKYDAKSFKKIDETIAFHAESLMIKHKNLEAIKLGLVRSSKDNVVQEPGIVLVCRCKSYIPIDEPYFPSKLQHPSSKTFYHTDVREGYFKLSSSLTRRPCEWNKELAMGCSIGPENDGISASLGPFVNIKETNELCFLTVRHLFQPLDLPDRRLLGLNVVQPADSDFGWSAQGQWNNRRCGTVKVAELSNNIDAALVEIYPPRAPSRGYFVGIQPGDLDDTGFAASCFPSYDDGCDRDARRFRGQDYAHDRVIKFGKQTGLTKGAIQIRNMAVRLRDETGHIQCGSRMQSRLMIQQLQIDSFARKIFFEKGDSGSAVFSVDKTNKLFCIGMAIGVMSDKTCIVTPIQNILERLGQKLRQTLELKAFPSENMEF